jgi:hypothetical protein
MKKLAIVGLALLTLMPATASAARVGVFIGGPVIRPWGFYGYRGYWGPWEAYPVYPRVGFPPSVGEVKLDTKLKTAEVYIDGNFAGDAGHLKTMNLKPGDYSVEVRAPGHETFQQDIHVLAGKTLILHPELPIEANVQPGS